jgi:PKD repeat protein
MGKHSIQIDYADKKRYTNDPEYHADEESRILNLLQRYWLIDNTQNIKPYFYLTEKEITHDLSLAPAVIIYNVKDDSEGIGIGYPAKKREKVIAIEIFSMDRGLLYDTKEEINRIVDFCRKRPILGWDFMFRTLSKRAEPRAGNHHFIINITLHRLVEYIPWDVWGWTASDPPELVPAFTATPVSGVAPLTVVFTNISQGAITEWLWTFTSGSTILTSVEKSPTVEFTIEGVYDVKLKVSNIATNAVLIVEDYIDVHSIPLYADFYSDVQSGITPLEVTFTDISTGSITDWAWTFTSGTTTITSTEANPVVNFTVVGEYDVQLVVSNINDSSTMLKTDYIDVLSPATIPGVPRDVETEVVNAGANIMLTWLAPLSDGGSPITEYTIYSTTTLDGVLVELDTVSGSELSYVHDIAVLGTSYYYKVSATNIVGEGPLSDIIAAFAWNASDLYFFLQMGGIMGYASYQDLLSAVHDAGKDDESDFVDYCKIEGVDTEGETIFALMEYIWPEIVDVSTASPGTYEDFVIMLEEVDITPTTIVAFLESWDNTEVETHYRTVQNPTEDTYIDEANPTVNYGSSTHLETSIIVAPESKMFSLLKFDISTITGTNVYVSESKLGMYPYDGFIGYSQIFYIARTMDLWSATEIVWNTGLNLLDNDRIMSGINIGIENEVNVQTLVDNTLIDGGSNLSLILNNVNNAFDSNWYSIYSVNSATNKPTLTLIYTVYSIFYYESLGDALDYIMPKILG